MRTVNKGVEKIQEICEKWRKCKNISHFHCDGVTRAKIGRFAAEKWTFINFVSNQTYSCTCISSSIRNTIVNR